MAAPAIDRRGLALAQGVLVTVHDLYGGAWPLRPLELYLGLARGFDVEPFRYRPRSQTLADSSGQLAGLLRSLKPHTSDDAVSFVTHGYGALVLRDAFRRIDWDRTRSKVIMLGPPNRGLQYYRLTKKNIGIAGWGGVAADELAALSADELDTRLGKLPRRCYPLVVSGSLSLNPFNQRHYPNDGLVRLEETQLPGEFRHQIVAAPHYLLPSHPLVMDLARGFLEA